MEKAQGELCSSKPQCPAHRRVCSTGAGALCARGRTKECENLGRGTCQSWEVPGHSPGKAVGKRAAMYQGKGRQPHSWEQTSFSSLNQIPGSHSGGAFMKRQKALTETQAQTSLPMLYFHWNKGMMKFIRDTWSLSIIEGSVLIVVSASSRTDVSLSQFYALETILLQLFSAYLQGREYLSNHPHQNQFSLGQRGGKHPFPEKPCWLFTPVKSLTSPCMSRLCHEIRSLVPENIVRVPQTLWNDTGRHKSLLTSLFLFHVFLKIALTNLLTHWNQ